MSTFGRRRTSLALTAALAVLLVGPATLAQSPGPSSSPDTGLPHSNVSELITFVPPTSTSVGFTDWGRIKASQGAQDVTGASPIDDKLLVVMSTIRDEGAASGFGIGHLRDHYETWGWDSLDLDWEATLQGDRSPVFVLRFRDGFDLESVAARFDSRGFSTTTVPGATIRSHAMNATDDWLRSTEFAILNTAFLDDGHTLVLSSALDQVQDVAANHGRYPTVAGLDATAAVLDGASAALLLPGLGTCVGFGPSPIPVGVATASLPPPSLSASASHPYAVLGIGYGRPDWDPIGRITFGYLDGQTAQSDLATRRQLAESGISLRAGVPYADAVFGVVDARVDGVNLTLDVSPANDAPRRLFDMVYVRDMVFAGC